MNAKSKHECIAVLCAVLVALMYIETLIGHVWCWQLSGNHDLQMFSWKCILRAFHINNSINYSFRWPMAMVIDTEWTGCAKV